VAAPSPVNQQSAIVNRKSVVVQFENQVEKFGMGIAQPSKTH
jgi:hypothetical protein